MTDTTLLTSIFGFAMLLVGLALTAYEFNGISRQRRSRMRLQPLSIERPRGARPAQWRDR